MIFLRESRRKYRETRRHPASRLRIHQGLIPSMLTRPLFILPCLLLAGCAFAEPHGKRAGAWPEGPLVEASGLAYTPAFGLFVAHNDDRDRHLYFLDSEYRDRGRLEISEARNRDWEDLALIEREGRPPILVIGDTGDNAGRHPFVRLHYLELGPKDSWLPDPPVTYRYLGWQKLVYPDEPEDCESIAYDPVQHRMLLLTKRTRPPELYAVDLPDPVAFPRGEPQRQTLTFLNFVPYLPDPTADYLVQNPGRGRWSAQPTGMDVAPDGSAAVIITYNDLQYYPVGESETLAGRLAQRPVSIDIEQLGQTEAVAFGATPRKVYVTTEGSAPAILEIDLDIVFAEP